MYKDLETEIVTVITMTGEIVGRLRRSGDDSIELTDPKLFVPSSDENGQPGFAPGISMTGQQNPDAVTFPLTSVITLLKSHDDVAKGWSRLVSGIII